MNSALLRTDIRQFLRRAELFARLLDPDLDYVVEKSDFLSLGRGEPLFGPGEKARRFFMVRSGEIGIYRREEGGAEREMARYIEGDVIGDFDFAVGAILDAAARAEGPAELLAFPSGSLGMEDLAAERPDIVARILLASLSMISSRLRGTQRLISENAPWVRELRKQIYTDPGTGLWSRAFLDEELPRSLAAPTAIALLKPDRFKELNDALGHQAGDAAMARLAEILVAEADAGGGWALRMRSNETAVVLPGCGPDAGKALAERLSAAVAAMEVPAAARAQGFSFTASLAYAIWPEDRPDWKGLVEGAYGLLTETWREGGARIRRLGREGSS